MTVLDGLWGGAGSLFHIYHQAATCIAILDLKKVIERLLSSRPKS